MSREDRKGSAIPAWRRPPPLDLPLLAVKIQAASATSSQSRLPMPTVTDLGKAFKLSHQGAYDDLADDQVGQAVKAKYPGAYDDFEDTPRPGLPNPVASGLTPRPLKDTG